MTGIWFSSDANITDRNLAKFITLLPASNMTPLGGKAAFICHGNPVCHCRVLRWRMLIKICAVLLSGATWRRGPTFYWGFQEPLRENFEDAFQCNLCCNTLSVRTIMNFLNLCDVHDFKSVRIHTFTYTYYLTYF